MKRNEELSLVYLGIAHEFRNPLQGIAASAGALSMRVEGDELAQRFVNLIQNEISRMSQIIDSMLELTHQVIFDQHPVFIERLVGEALEVLKEEIELRKTAVSVHIVKELPAVEGDGQKLSRVFAALIKNAIESKESEVNLKITISGNKKGVTVEIQDNGRGIAEDAMDRIFQPFFSTLPKHAGLGLAVAQRVIGAHSGKLKLKSNSNGTTVTVWFPVLSTRKTTSPQ